MQNIEFSIKNGIINITWYDGETIWPSCKKSQIAFSGVCYPILKEGFLKHPMDLTLVIIVLLFAVLGFVFILGKPKSNDKTGSDRTSGEGSPKGAESTFSSTSSSSPSAS